MSAFCSAVEDRAVVGRKLRQVHLGAHLEAIFEHRHHAQAEQVHFDDAEIGAILLIPLHYDPAGHGGGLQRHDGIERALADHHAAGMLAEVARQILRHLVEFAKFAHARMVEVEAGIAELALGGLLGIFPFPGPHQAAELFQAGDFEAQRLAHFARRGAPAIRDDVGRHRRAQFAEALVNVLDGLFAFVPAGQIDIDIRPLAALFAEEAFEEKVHAHGVHRGDFERVADRAVGGAAAALREDIVLLAEAHDVPNDEEVAWQFQLFNHCKLAFHLQARALVIGPVTAARPLVREFAQQAHLRLTFGDGVSRELVSEVGQRKIQTLGDFVRVGDGLGEIREKPRHFGVRLDVALAVAFQQTASGGQRDFVADAGEDVQQFALRRDGIGGIVGGDERDAETAGALDYLLVVRLFLAVVMALQFGAKSVLAEDIEQALVGMRGETDQPVREFGEFLQGGRAFALRRAQFHAGDQAAEVPVAFAGSGQQGIGASVGAGDFAADVCPHAGLFGRHVESWRTVDAIAVQQRHGGHVQACACAGKLFRHAGAFQKAEGGARVQFDVSVMHRPARWALRFLCVSASRVETS